MPRWTKEARQRQSELIRAWQPWRHSTGPKTEAGKAVSRYNAFTFGHYGWEAKAFWKNGADVIKQARAYIRWLKYQAKLKKLKR